MNTPVMIETRWAEFIKTHSPRLRAELITTYIPLVRMIVNRLHIPESGALEIDDLVSHGMIGLINAVDRYDPSRGVCFEAFATQRIRGAVIDQLRTLSWLPRSALTRMRQIETVMSTLEQQLGRSVSEQEIAETLGITLARYWQTMQEISTTIFSLEAPLGISPLDEEAITLYDMLEDRVTLEPPLWLERYELMQSLRAGMQRLPERERLLLTWYYWEEQTMREISHKLAVSESRVCQLHAQAVLRLRALLNNTSEPATIQNPHNTHNTHKVAVKVGGRR